MAVTKFVPVSEIDPKLLPEVQNYLPQYDEDNVFVGLGKPGKDSYRRGFMCDVDEEGNVLKVRYDLLLTFDGPIDENGHAIPSAVMVVIEKRRSGYFLHCINEYRPLIYDHVTGQQGVTVCGFAGGFTEKGKSPRDTALSEVLEEQGVKVRSAKIVRIGYASMNRAAIETCPEVYLGIFSRQDSQHLGSDEVITKGECLRVDNFHTGLDGIVNSAYAMVLDYLGLVSTGNFWIDLWKSIKRLFKPVI